MAFVRAGLFLEVGQASALVDIRGASQSDNYMRIMFGGAGADERLKKTLGWKNISAKLKVKYAYNNTWYKSVQYT